MQLINFKKVQEALQYENGVNQFMDNKEESELICENFAKIWSTEDINSEEKRQ